MHILLHQNLAEGLSGLAELERSRGGGLDEMLKVRGEIRLSEFVGTDGAPRLQTLELIARSPAAEI